MDVANSAPNLLARKEGATIATELVANAEGQLLVAGFSETQLAFVRDWTATAGAKSFLEWTDGEFGGVDANFAAEFIAACTWSAANKRPIYVPGTFQLTGPIALSTLDDIVFTGPGAFKIMNAAGDNSTITFTTCHRPVFQGPRFLTANGASVSEATTTRALRFVSCDEVTVDQCDFAKYRGYPIEISGGKGHFVTRNKLHDSFAGLVKITGAAQSWIVLGNQSKAPGLDAIYIFGASGDSAQVIGGTVFGNQTWDGLANGVFVAGARTITVACNPTKNMQGSGVRVDRTSGTKDTQNITVGGNAINTPGQDATSPAIYITASAGKTEGTIIGENPIVNAGARGVVAEATGTGLVTYTQIGENPIDGTVGPGCELIKCTVSTTVDENDFNNCANGETIKAGATCTGYLRINGNTFSDPNSGGAAGNDVIDIAADIGCDKVEIRHNVRSSAANAVGYFINLNSESNLAKVEMGGNWEVAGNDGINAPWTVSPTGLTGTATSITGSIVWEGDHVDVHVTIVPDGSGISATAATIPLPIPVVGGLIGSVIRRSGSPGTLTSIGPCFVNAIGGGTRINLPNWTNTTDTIEITARYYRGNT